MNKSSRNKILKFFKDLNLPTGDLWETRNMIKILAEKKKILEIYKSMEELE